MTLYKGDDLQAFDGLPIEITIDSELDVSKAIFVINGGVIVKTFINPVFPIYVELDNEDTAKLEHNNYANLILYDSLGRKKTCDNELRFKAKSEVYSES